MSNRLIREGKTWHEYKVCISAGGHGEATKVRFGPRDGWVGDDYWYHVRSYTPSRKERAYLLMSKLENRKRTKSLLYETVRKILYQELGWTKRVTQETENETNESNNNGL